jgi:hypothetical protein
MQPEKVCGNAGQQLGEQKGEQSLHQRGDKCHLHCAHVRSLFVFNFFPDPLHCRSVPGALQVVDSLLALSQGAE